MADHHRGDDVPRGLGSDLHGVAVGDHEDPFELQLGTRLGGDAVDQDPIPGRHPILLAAAHDDGRD